MVIGPPGDLGQHALKIVAQELKLGLVHVTILHP